MNVSRLSKHVRPFRLVRLFALLAFLAAPTGDQSRKALLPSKIVDGIWRFGLFSHRFCECFEAVDTVRSRIIRLFSFFSLSLAHPPLVLSSLPGSSTGPLIPNAMTSQSIPPLLLLELWFYRNVSSNPPPPVSTSPLRSNAI